MIEDPRAEYAKQEGLDRERVRLNQSLAERSPEGFQTLKAGMEYESPNDPTARRNSPLHQLRQSITNKDPQLFGKELHPEAELQLWRESPGDRGYDDWLRHDDTKFHGTFHPEWDSAPNTHFGTHRAATQRLMRSGESINHDVNAYQDEASIEEIRDQFVPGASDFGEGRIHARRISQGEFGSTKYDDEDANTAQYIAESMDNYEPSTSVRSSSHQELVDEADHYHSREVDNIDAYDEGRTDEIDSRYQDTFMALDDLRSGRPVWYTNKAEDQGSNSVVSPSGSYSSYYEDVYNSPNRTPAEKEYARSRLDQGRSGDLQVPISTDDGGDVTALPSPLSHQFSQTFDRANEGRSWDPRRSAW